MNAPILSSLQLQRLNEGMSNSGEEVILWENADYKISRIPLRDNPDFYQFSVKNAVDHEVDVYAAYMGPVVHHQAHKVLFIAHEPEPYRQSNDDINAHHSSFYKIIHNNDQLATSLPSDKQIQALGIFTYGSYLRGLTPVPIEPKEFSISLLASVSYGSWSANPYNLQRPGLVFHYQDRIQTFERESEIHSLPTRFYVSSRGNIPEKFKTTRTMPTDYKAEHLYKSQFTIVIENVRERLYFSEKIYEPLLNKVIPIYIGCPNIGDYFEVRGLLIADNCDDIIRLCNTLSPETYEQMRPYVEENYRRAQILYRDNSFDKILGRSGIEVGSGKKANLNFLAKFSLQLLFNTYLYEREDENREEKLITREISKIIKECYGGR